MPATCPGVRPTRSQLQGPVNYFFAASKGETSCASIIASDDITMPSRRVHPKGSWIAGFAARDTCWPCR